ncbi:MAG: S1/P1 nuclease [Muribaculaceae bacterium]|nr:S1/P1 nuclease [Muribaculaceae bacterium]
MVYYANWLDNASHTPEYSYSKTWHYKNIDANETFENAQLHESGDVVRAIREQAYILNNPDSSDEQKSLALKMLVHLVGDIHQPMHMGHRSDLGGNRWMVKYFNSPKNLHSIWDSSLPESAHKWSYTEWQQQIDRATPEEEAEIIADGSPEKWGKECYQIAAEVYNTTPEDSKLSYDYIARWTPVIEEQFLRGGLRLADLLNSIFDPHYAGANNIIKKN